MPLWPTAFDERVGAKAEPTAGREAVQAGTDWGAVAGYCGLLAGFALACLMLATRAFRAYQAQV